MLHARVGQAESVLAYAALADLLSGVEQEVIAGLPEMQRLAVDRVLLRASDGGPPTDQRMVAAAFATVVDRIAVDVPLLVAIDDVQWLDPSSQMVLAFAARRLNGRIGLLATERCDPDCGDAMTWLHLSRPGGIERIRVGHMSLGGLHALISARLGRTFPRPTMVRIFEISGGNPFYALELAHAMHVGSSRAQPSLPTTLAELMRLRIGSLEGEAGDALLAAAAVADPTVELLAQVLDTTVERTVELLEESENKGIVAIDGNVVRFSHPLLAQSVYTDAKPARRRATHRSLAEVTVLPELKARHMALAASSADAETLKALDSAADVARGRGAPAAAAELIELAIALGGNTPSRRVRAAEHHFKAGDAHRARTLLEPTIGELQPGLLRGIALNLMAGIHMYDDRFVEAATLLKRALGDAENNPAVQIQTLIVVGICARHVRRLRRIAAQREPSGDACRGTWFSAADQPSTRDVRKCAIPLRARSRRTQPAPGCGARGPHHRRPYPVLCECRQRHDQRMDGTAECRSQADGGGQRPMCRMGRRERLDGSHRLLHAHRDLARRLRRSRATGRGHLRTSRAGRRFARDRADCARRSRRIRRARAMKHVPTPLRP